MGASPRLGATWGRCCGQGASLLLGGARNLRRSRRGCVAVSRRPRRGRRVARVAVSGHARQVASGPVGRPRVPRRTRHGRREAATSERSGRTSTVSMCLRMHRPPCHADLFSAVRVPPRRGVFFPTCRVRLRASAVERDARVGPPSARWEPSRGGPGAPLTAGRTPTRRRPRGGRHDAQLCLAYADVSARGLRRTRPVVPPTTSWACASLWSGPGPPARSAPTPQCGPTRTCHDGRSERGTLVSSLNEESLVPPCRRVERYRYVSTDVPGASPPADASPVCRPRLPGRAPRTPSSPRVATRPFRRPGRGVRIQPGTLFPPVRTRPARPAPPPRPSADLPARATTVAPKEERGSHRSMMRRSFRLGGEQSDSGTCLR